MGSGQQEPENIYYQQSFWKWKSYYTLVWLFTVRCKYSKIDCSFSHLLQFDVWHEDTYRVFHPVIMTQNILFKHKHFNKQPLKPVFVSLHIFHLFEQFLSLTRILVFRIELHDWAIIFNLTWTKLIDGDNDM